MKKLLGKLLLILIVIVIVVGIIVVVKPEVFQITTNKTSETALIQDKLVELSEWTTLKYEYSKVLISRNNDVALLGIKDINYFETIKLISYTGYLKAGTDVSKIQISYDKISKKLFVKVPKSKILENVVDTENMKVEDVKGNIFTDHPTQKILADINADKKLVKEEKISQGFLEEADKRIKLLLTSFLGANGFTDVVVEFY